MEDEKEEEEDGEKELIVTVLLNKKHKGSSFKPLIESSADSNVFCPSHKYEVEVTCGHEK